MTISIFSSFIFSVNKPRYNVLRFFISTLKRGPAQTFSSGELESVHPRSKPKLMAVQDEKMPSVDLSFSYSCTTSAYLQFQKSQTEM